MRKQTWCVVLGLAFALGATPAAAQSVQQFLETAERIPMNATALLRSDTRRLMGQFRGAMTTVRAEQTARVARGEPKTICMPDKVALGANDILNRFRAIPASRRNMTVTQAVREWMADEYPC